MIETLGEGFHSEEMKGHLRKVDSKERYFGPFCIFEVICGRGGIYVIHRGGRTFGGLVLQGQPDRSLEKNIFDGSCTEEGTVAGEAILEGGLKFAPSEVRN